MDESTSCLCFKLSSEKSSPGDIVALQWSPKMDLLAMAMKDGSVILNRLSWQRVWTAQPTDSAVTSLSWRPDGRVLAVAHADGTVLLRGLEDAKILHQFTIGVEISYLSWTIHPQVSYHSYKDESASFTPLLESLDESEGYCPRDPKNLTSLSGTPNILSIGDVGGRVYLYISGLFHAATINTQSPADTVLWTMFTSNLEHLCVVSLPRSCEQLRFHSFTIPLLKPRISELSYIAIQFGYISSLIKYMNGVLQSMMEAWEDVLLMMDTKLADYASTLPEGTTLADELLVLLACGRARLELRKFLVDELSEKGLQKLGQSIRLSYRSIKKTICCRLLSSISSLQYHLCELLGMARWYDRFGVVGLSPAEVQGCLNALGQFALKSHELLLVIDSSVKSGEVFFDWIIQVIRKLSGGTHPPGSRQCPDHVELALLMEFLKKRLAPTNKPGTKKQHFNLEIVGQYFDDQDLPYVMEKTLSSWEEILTKAGLDTTNTPWLISPQPSKSLAQLFHCLHKHLDRLFSKTNESLSHSVIPAHCWESAVYEGDTKITTKELQGLIGSFSMDQTSYLYFPAKSCMGCVEFSPNNSFGKVKHFNFIASNSNNISRNPTSIQNYNSDTLSVLLNASTPGDPSFLAQLSTETLLQLEDDCITSLNDSLMGAEDLGAFPAEILAVTGSRKIACVVSTSNRIRIYDVDVDINEDEDL
ncbi:anaphase-promoting complex subunit 4-like [Dysidea avara]|uniref:anaphase-promoting complex subunit 4-like n=1 Tax=Dysidea avara TaxID=196820 RepID=UPI0033294A7F